MKKNNIHVKDIKVFHQGNSINCYEFLGSKLVEENGVSCVRFTVWAPNAKKVMVVGSFNNWNGEKHVMRKISNSKLWTIFIPEAKEKDLYKYKIITKNGETLLKSDPFAFYSEKRPDTASIVTDIDKFKWFDDNWYKKRKNYDDYKSPMNIYEVHLGSWRTNEDGSFKNYREIADELSDYVKDMEYTHIEILPICEHPLDDSWGYQTTGYYSVTSRYGTPEDFKYFVNTFHNKNIGVIMDWVPSHFCKDSHGLYQFDGSYVYECNDPVLRENLDWGTANFDFSKPEIHSFLISNAVFWMKEYHIDAIRADAVANMLYLDYGKKDNHQIKNCYGGNENLNAINFIQKLNKAIFNNFDNPLMIAEESTVWPQVTKPTYVGGLGFNFKWNMGWMNDLLKYIEMDPIHRKWHHNLITFSLMYAFSENFILPLSHDEVVHGKKSLLDKMPGNYLQKFSSLRMFYGYMMTHPGKKLLFMGGEIGEFIEWRFNEQLEWHLLKFPIHNGLKKYVKALNHFYIKEKSLWELDHTSEGFTWIDHQNYNQSIISFIRKSSDKNDFIIVVCNFTPVQYEDYKVGVPRFITYEEVFNSDILDYGGSGQVNNEVLHPVRENWNTQPYHINIKIPPLSTIILKPIFENISKEMEG
jgi:1,4-alpha-glucan branching enzyme